jgi:hypothetical protein
MAVSGVDWRKPTDGYRTEPASEACSARSEIGGSTAPSDPPASGRCGGVARTLAEKTDEKGSVTVPNTVETDDFAVPEPLAIGVTGTAVDTECPEEKHADDVNADDPETGNPSGHDFDGGGFYLRYFTPDPGTRRGTVIVE